MQIGLVLSFFFLTVSAKSASWLVGIIDKQLLTAIDDLDLEITDADLEKMELNFGQQPGSVDAATGCNYTQYAPLFTQFTIDAGFDQSINYTNNGTALKAAVNNVFQTLPTNDLATAQKAFDSFCMAQRTFFQNLGIVAIDNCFLPNVYVANGYDRLSAYQTFQIFHQLNYQCGAVFTKYASFLLDYLNNLKSRKTDLETCTDAFLTTLNSPVTDHGCSAMQTYEHCYGKVFYQATNNSDLAWTVCEAVRRVNVVVLPKCHDTTWFCQLSAINS